MELDQIPDNELPQPPAGFFKQQSGVAVTQATTTQQPTANPESAPPTQRRQRQVSRQPSYIQQATVTNMKEELYPLPSCGLAYTNSPMSLIGGDSVRVRPMLVGDQRRAGSAGTDPYNIYQRLLSKTVLEPNMNLFLDDMLLSDATAILWAVRSLTWGPMYKIDFPCPGCKSIRTQELDTGMLQVKMASDIENYQAEDIAIKIGDNVITLHLPTMRDQKNLTPNVARLTKQRLLDDPELDKPFVLVASYIDTINGEEVTIDQKFLFVDNLYQQDFDQIMEKIIEMDSGITPTQAFKCKRCSTDVEVTLTVTPEFFRPSSDKR